MDADRFDQLTRVLAKTPSRRTALRGVLAASASLLVAARGADAAGRCREIGVVCSKNSDCCLGPCGARDRTGRRTCVCPSGERLCSEACCPDDVSCDPDGGCCVGIGSVPTGGNCQQDGECCGGVCDEYSNRCYTSCVPAGGVTTSELACCMRYYAYIDGDEIICADACLANGVQPVDSDYDGLCCSGYIDENGFCAPQPAG